MKLPILQPKDSICIVAPAGKVAMQDIQSSISYIQQQDWNPIFGKNTFKKYQFGYAYSGSEQQRFEDFQWALNHPTAKVIWCARGGYGGVHLIDQLDFSQFRKNPKWIIGYSDNTVFHQYLSLYNIPSIHGLVLKPLPQSHTHASYRSIKKILTAKELSYTIKSHKHNQTGTVKAKISGGNLSIIYSLLQSNTIDTFQDKILFLEDWHENHYHLDRMLTAIERAGIFTRIKGIIVGGFTKMDDKQQPNYEKPFDKLSYEIINYRIKSYHFPKIFAFPAGHIKDNRALLMSIETTMEVTEEYAKLTFH